MSELKRIIRPELDKIVNDAIARRTLQEVHPFDEAHGLKGGKKLEMTPLAAKVFKNRKRRDRENFANRRRP
jgi:hypothetical protein